MISNEFIQHLILTVSIHTSIKLGKDTVNYFLFPTLHKASKWDSITATNILRRSQGHNPDMYPFDAHMLALTNTKNIFSQEIVLLTPTNSLHLDSFWSENAYPKAIHSPFSPTNDITNNKPAEYRYSYRGNPYKPHTLLCYMNSGLVIINPSSSSAATMTDGMKRALIPYHVQSEIVHHLSKPETQDAIIALEKIRMLNLMGESISRAKNLLPLMENHIAKYYQEFQE